ncbi:MAG: MgtC/SapB family protein [Gammaproteobacteria bacterium]
MTDPDPLFRLAIALAIGFLLGLERGWRERDEPAGARAAGVRTFSLLGLLGGTAGLLASTLGAGVFGATTLVTGAALTLFMYRQAVQARRLSVTSLVAALLAFLLGALAVIGDVHAAGAAAVAAAVLLALREPLHHWLASVTWPELSSALVLATMTFILLPLLPDRTIDPWQVLNPYRLWVMTIMIAVVSFVGYVAVRLAGPRQGTLLAAVAGGSVSSTAVTLTFADRVRDNPRGAWMLAAGIIAAGGTMMLRVLIVAGIFNPALLAFLAPPLVGALVAGGLFAWWAIAHDDATGGGGELAIGNPFELPEVLKFALLLVLILLAAHGAQRLLGDTGLLGVAALSGVVDVDAITLTAATLPGSAEFPSRVILVAVAANSLTKVALTAWAGNRALAGRVLAGTCAMAAAAAGVYAFT